jgi:hypothetical protein
MGFDIKSEVGTDHTRPTLHQKYLKGSMKRQRSSQFTRIGTLWTIFCCVMAMGSSEQRVTSNNGDVYGMLARAIRHRLDDDDNDNVDIDSVDYSRIVSALRSLSGAQKTFKGLDGAAHEAYRKTHDDNVDLNVAGRATRAAARTGAVAHALACCELCELAEFPERFDLESENGTLAARTVVLNHTAATKIGGAGVNLLVIYESHYGGGSGIHHCSIEDLTNAQKVKKSRGRLLIVISDGISSDLEASLRILEAPPSHVRYKQGPEIASVQRKLYKAAGELISVMEPFLRSYNASAIHLTGRSLSGGIAALAASILDGEIAMPGEKKQQSAPKSKSKKVHKQTSKNTTIPEECPPLQGLCKGRVSAVTLGAPPCFSANVQADFITSILYGDDMICRVSPESFDRFLKRTRRALKSGGLIGKRLNWMTDTFSLTAANLQSHALGSVGEEARLSIPGRAFLIRPRRLGSLCSIHEVGAQLKGGREALRAAVLWQLNDILMSRSMWKHHQLESYIHGLDRVHLRHLDEKSIE